MNDDEILEQVKAEALGALSWMDGYTDTWPDGGQRRVTTVREDKTSVVKRFESQHPYLHQPDRLFEVTVSVKAVTA